MTRPSLAGIEKRTAAATEGPWEVNGPDEDWAVIHSGPDSVIHAYTAHDPDCERCTCGGDEAGHVAISVEDAELIAHARTDLDALTAAVRDVLAALTPHWDAQVRREAKFGRSGSACVCEACNAVRALATHLDLTDTEGDPT